MGIKDLLKKIFSEEEMKAESEYLSSLTEEEKRDCLRFVNLTLDTTKKDGQTNYDAAKKAISVLKEKSSSDKEKKRYMLIILNVRKKQAFEHALIQTQIDLKERDLMAAFDIVDSSDFSDIEKQSIKNYLKETIGIMIGKGLI